MRKTILWLALGAASVMLSACGGGNIARDSEPLAGSEAPESGAAPGGGSALSADQYLWKDLVPENLSLQLNVTDPVFLSQPAGAWTVSEYAAGGNSVSWLYPDEQIAVHLTQEQDYLILTFAYQGAAQEEAAVTFPSVQAEDYTLPLGEGKYFTAADPVWRDYLGGTEREFIESFSMPFLAAGYGEQAVVYIFPENFNNEVIFTEGEALGFAVKHTYSTVNADKTYQVRIYVTDNTPAAIAGIYKSYLAENGGIKTLEEKAAENPSIRKLYGAPHIYLFDETVVSAEDVNWPAFIKNLNSPELNRLKDFSAGQPDSDGSFLSVLDELAGQDYVNAYQKRVITQELSRLLLADDFYQVETLKQADETGTGRTDEAGSQPNSTGRADNRAGVIERNKQALYERLPGVFQAPETWSDSRTTGLLAAMSDAGIEHAWIGLNSWEQAYIKPELAEYAEARGWLIATYDSYHSVHEPGQEQWATAAFPAEVYENYAVKHQDGSYAKGFQSVGRKFNPTLSVPYVTARVEEVLDNQPLFNSWFVDCDATGEIYDDYSSEHPTSMKEDVTARLERMEMLAKDYQLVVGSEGGHDFAANTIAFAHGIELPSFSWMDEDMKANRDSEYYLGRWYAADGGVPEKFAKPTPIKENYHDLFLNPASNVPLFKLVYNNAVITTYHWDWSSLKIQGEEQNRRLYEMLYNVPPMYHLDKFVWAEQGAEIAAHVREWSEWSSQIINKEMTDFQVLTDDRKVQLATYEDRSILANWSDAPFEYNGHEIPSGEYYMFGE